MVVKVYISGISGNKEVKKRQQRVLMILDSRSFKYELVDITEPGNETDKDFMQNNSTSLGATIGDTNPRHPLPPQIFNDSTYCGDYDQFDLSNEMDELEKFLKLAPDDSVQAVTSSAEIQLTKNTNGAALQDASKEEETNEAEAMETSNEAEAVQKDRGEVNGSTTTTQEEADGGNVDEDGGEDEADDAE